MSNTTEFKLHTGSYTCNGFIGFIRGVYGVCAPDIWRGIGIGGIVFNDNGPGKSLKLVLEKQDNSKEPEWRFFQISVLDNAGNAQGDFRYPREDFTLVENADVWRWERNTSLPLIKDRDYLCLWG
ncbi:MAG: hypothetical protein HRU20_28665 [Pseudomonadales bacterium]|nr:hypothetical protein [Pseudomonadales bacterium]